MLGRRKAPPRLFPPPPPSPALSTTSPSHGTTSPSHSSHLHTTPTPPPRPPSTPHSRPPTSQKHPLTPTPLTVYSSYSSLQIASLKLTSQESSEENHTSRFDRREYEALLRRGNTLIVCVTMSAPLHSSYSISLTFISAYCSSDRFGQFRAQGAAPRSQELWFSISLPPNFPVGKFHTHVHLSVRRGSDVATYFHHKPVAVLFNPWNPDDDTFIEDTDDLENHLLADVGTIWRGTARQPSPILWEYGQYAPNCLDVALHLLHGLSVADRRRAAAVAKSIVEQVNCHDSTGVMTEGYSRSYTGGMHPCRWNGSPAILQRFYRNHTPVRYGQCWVLTGVAITLLRALGIGCRPVTCYEAAHLCTKLGQVDFCFTPHGEMLDDATQDQLWIYHVWLEAWMSRDDLPPGHNGWQIFDPTSQQRQGGPHRIGPVSLASLREGRVGSGKKGEGGNGLEYVRSEVNADMRFLRVSKSFATITNRVLSVALVRHNQVGVRLVAGNGNSLTPLNVTDTYKEAELKEETTPTHFPPPSRDCSVDVTTNDAAKLGDNIALTVTIGNEGPLLRTLDGKVGGHVVRYNGVAVREFLSMQFSGVVAPGQSASVTLPIEARQYMKLLVEQCMLRFFVAVKARETGQLYLKVHHFQLQLPRLDVKCDECRVTVGKVTRVRVTFRNPLSCSLSRLLFLVQAQGLCAQRELTYQRLVLPGHVAKMEFPIRAQSPGTYHILASLHCDQVTDIRGWTEVTVLPPT